MASTRSATATIAAIMVAAAVASGCGPETAGERARDAEHRERERIANTPESERVIVCAHDSSNSGNVCRVKVGDAECVAVIPDENTKPVGTDVQLISCPKVTPDD